MAGRREYDKLSTFELAKCLSNYDLGVIGTITEFRRGSRRAPKLVIQADKGKFLLKRRIQGRDDLAKVAFTHQIQISLAAQNFPLPHLIGTRDNNSMLVMDSNLYEIFEFIEGVNFDGSANSTTSAGRIQGLYHKLLQDFSGDYRPPKGSYHNASAIHKAIIGTVNSLPCETRPSGEDLTTTIDKLERAYVTCARKSDEIGLCDWPKQIVHGDWHPGNMLFRDGHVVGVIDYDAARLQQRAVDLANGALQFSIRGGSPDPSKWPDELDLKRFKQFIVGYDTANVISKLELRALPFLMCEAMIAEAVLPIAATGSFGRMPGFPFLMMVGRKVKWILQNIESLCSVLDG